MSENAGWVKVAHRNDLEPGTGYETGIEFDDEEVGVFEINGSYYALGACPHEHGPLSQGIIENATVKCPWHSAIFDITTGKCLSGPSACRVDGSVISGEIEASPSLVPCTSFEVKIENEEIWIRKKPGAN